MRARDAREIANDRATDSAREGGGCVGTPPRRSSSSLSSLSSSSSSSSSSLLARPARLSPALTNAPRRILRARARARPPNAGPVTATRTRIRAESKAGRRWRSRRIEPSTAAAGIARPRAAAPRTVRIPRVWLACPLPPSASSLPLSTSPHRRQHQPRARPRLGRPSFASHPLSLSPTSNPAAFYPLLVPPGHSLRSQLPPAAREEGTQEGPQLHPPEVEVEEVEVLQEEVERTRIFNLCASMIFRCIARGLTAAGRQVFPAAPPKRPPRPFRRRPILFIYILRCALRCTLRCTLRCALRCALRCTSRCTSRCTLHCTLDRSCAPIPSKATTNSLRG
jgi:hypothetical protein